MTVSIERDLAIELVNDKLKTIDESILKILHKWDYDNIDDFIEDSKKSKIDSTSVDDAIDIQNLRYKRAEVAKIFG